MEKLGAPDRPVCESAGVGIAKECDIRMNGGDATMTIVMTDELISRAQAGDGDAFREMTEPRLRELQVHCYRMLGSFHDAEDALQDTLLTAWQGLAGFEGRASLRTWLYKIATNRCLNLRRAAGRRLAKEWNIPGIQPPEPTSLGEVAWLEPYPDEILAGVIEAPLGPEARYEQTESISIAFITALQLLPPRQLTVLILRDVLGFPAKEVAEMLDSTVESVTSALKRARTSLGRRSSAVDDRVSRPVSGSAAESAIVAKFVSAYESGDLDALVTLLTDDVFMSMPPMALEYRGRDLVASFFALLFGSGRQFRLVATRANGQPAFGLYALAPDGTLQASGFITIALRGDRVSSVTRFESAVLPAFGFAATLRI
jgi:RNA polymerase sigma-70 factor (ECF subfamily)